MTTAVAWVALFAAALFAGASSAGWWFLRARVRQLEVEVIDLTKWVVDRESK